MNKQPRMSKVNEGQIVWEFDDALSSEPEEANKLVRQIADKLSRLQWQESDIFAVHMALEEALMNAIKHGNQHDASKPIDVLIRIREDSLYARIEDQGNGFDPDTVPDPCHDSNLQKPSGRGVALIRNFVDFVEYNAAGNAIEFRKSRTAVD